MPTIANAHTIGTVEVGIGIYGLRLKPEAEGKSPVLQVPGQPFQPLGEFFSVHGIISQSGAVVVPSREPAVVQHEQLTASAKWSFGQLASI